jgi:hypothetical protein
VRCNATIFKSASYDVTAITVSQSFCLGKIINDSYSLLLDFKVYSIVANDKKNRTDIHPAQRKSDI